MPRLKGKVNRQEMSQVIFKTLLVESGCQIILCCFQLSSNRWSWRLDRVLEFWWIRLRCTTFGSYLCDCWGSALFVPYLSVCGMLLSPVCHRCFLLSAYPEMLVFHIPILPIPLLFCVPLQWRWRYRRHFWSKILAEFLVVRFSPGHCDLNARLSEQNLTTDHNQDKHRFSKPLKHYSITR